MPEFYQQFPGAVVSFTINKYIYVSVNKKFDGRTRVSYSRTEIVDRLDDLDHELVRETLREVGEKGLEITSISDIPGEGSGLGSSSAFTVGLIMALNSYMDGQPYSHPSVFSEAAHYIERELCGHPVGKQDHYAAAHGGLRFYQFNTDDTVSAELIQVSSNTRNFLESHIMLMWTGRVRKADYILKEQGQRFQSKETLFDGQLLAAYARQARGILEDGRVNELGDLLDRNWQRKKELAGVSDPEIDEVYTRAKAAGAIGGKVCGAGGGGFMIFVAEPECQSEIEKATGLRRVLFKIEEKGSQIIYKG